MRLSRIYTSQPLAVADTVIIEGPKSHYLSHVLRLSEGDPVTLFNGDGSDYAGRIVDLHRQKVRVLLSDSLIRSNESPLKITLVQAISRGERMDYTLQKATELGVHRIQPLLTRRVEVRLNQKRQANRLEHWRGVVISASEQSGRALVPMVLNPLPLPEWLSEKGPDCRLVLDPDAHVSLSSYPLEDGPVSILIGPEGGLDTAELAQARASSVTPVSLGPRVLRTESAGPAAIAVLQSMAGDL